MRSIAQILPGVATDVACHKTQQLTEKSGTNLGLAVFLATADQISLKVISTCTWFKYC